jgi:TolB-like protein
MLAVLPFEHEGPDDQAPFTNGLTDALTAKLGALPGLAVIDRQSASQYRRTTKPARQIGGELGVPYLVQGVVRWARTPAGAWRAQVTPTLVDAAKGITKWTGEPVLITPEDPFSAQASIAQRVAEALEVQLRPVDRAALARRQTGNPEAFAAYQRGRALTDAYEGAGSSAAVMQQAIAQFERAISLDSSFAVAWSALVGSRMQLAINAPGDREADRRMRLAMDAAAAHIPGDPLLLQDIAYRKLFFDRDTVGVDDLVSRALAAAGNDARVLGFGALHVAYRQQRYDSAYVLAARAARLDPRSPVAMSAAIALATFLRRWPDARNYADQLILLDSASSQGWWSRAQIELYIGDTVALARELSRGLAHVSRATPTLLSYLAYAGSSDARHFVSLSMADARPARLADTVVAYYGAKADAFARLGNDAAARAQYDSIRAMLSGRTLSGFFEAGMLFRLAHAQAVLGQMAPARETMDRAFRVARSSSARANLFDVVEPDVIAATYARLGEPEKAVAWLESIVKDRGASWTARGLANRPKLLLLRGTPAYERFLRDGGRGQP